MGRFGLAGVILASCSCVIAVISVAGVQWQRPSDFRIRFALPPTTSDTSAPARPSETPSDSQAPAKPVALAEKVGAAAIPLGTANLAAGPHLAIYDIDYDLKESVAVNNRGSSETALTMPVGVEGKIVGSAHFRVGSGSQVLISRRDLEALVEIPGLDAGDAGFVSFDQLRDRGLTVRYDPLKGVVEIGR